MQVQQNSNALSSRTNVVKLASPVVGVIARLDVDRGDIVRQGQIVGKLEDGVEAATLALAQARATNEYVSKSHEARLQFLRSKYKRLNELHSKAISSQASLEEADAEAKVAEQQLKEAELNREVAYLEIRHAEEVLKQRTLRSPIDGVVVERLLVPGEYQNEQTPILTLAQIDPLRVEVFVSTSYYGRIRTGSKAEVRPEQPVGGVYTAVVTVVDRVLDAASGTFGVRLALPNPDLLLPAGIPCKVLFEMHPTEGCRPWRATARDQISKAQLTVQVPRPGAPLPTVILMRCTTVLPSGNFTSNVRASTPTKSARER